MACFASPVSSCRRFSAGIFTMRTRSSRLDRDLPRRILVFRVLAPAQRERDRGDDRDEQDHRRDLERRKRIGVEQPPELLRVAVVSACCRGGAAARRRSSDRATTRYHLDHEQRRDDDAERQIAPEAFAQRSILMSSIITTNRNSTMTAPT